MHATRQRQRRRHRHRRMRGVANADRCAPCVSDEYKSHYTSQIDALHTQLDRAHSTIQELSTWKYHAEMEMVKSVDERRALTMRLLMTVRAHAQLKHYK